jgi:3-deoxy-D-manno-octulosonic-acid transferase
MQSEADAERIRALGVPPSRVHVTGNVKWDVTRPQEPAEAVRARLGISPDSLVLVAGSTSEGEEEIVLTAFSRLRRAFPTLRLVIAPRHPRRFDGVAGLLSRRGIPFVRRSLGQKLEEKPIMLLDTLGELATTYGAATVCFVGGSLVARGGQNLMEPAACGRPVIFGPRTENFAGAAAELIKAGAGFRITNTETLVTTVQDLLQDSAACAASGRSGLEIVARNQGATRRNAEAIEAILDGLDA